MNMGPLIPLFMKLAPPLVVPIMQIVESAFGSKKGPAKMETAAVAVGKIFEELIKEGVIPDIPRGEDLAAALEIIFQGNKQKIEAARETPVSLTAPAGHKIIYVPDGARVVSIEFPA